MCERNLATNEKLCFHIKSFFNVKYSEDNMASKAIL